MERDKSLVNYEGRENEQKGSGMSVYYTLAKWSKGVFWTRHVHRCRRERSHIRSPVGCTSRVTLRERDRKPKGDDGTTVSTSSCGAGVANCWRAKCVDRPVTDPLLTEGEKTASLRGDNRSTITSSEILPPLKLPP